MSLIPDDIINPKYHDFDEIQEPQDEGEEDYSDEDFSL